MELLLSRCSECGSQLRWRSALPIELCQTCHIDLRRCSAPKVRDRDVEVLRVAAQLLSTDAKVQREAISTISIDLRHFSAFEIFELGWNLGRQFGPKRAVISRNNSRASRTELRNAKQASEFAIEKLALGFHLLTGWPKSIENLVSLYSDDGCTLVSCQMATRLRSLASSPRLASEMRSILGLKLNPTPSARRGEKTGPTAVSRKPKFNEEYAAQRDARGLLTHREATKFLGIKSATLTTSRRTAILPEQLPGIRGNLFRKSELEPLRQRLSDRIPESHVRRQFGLSSLACQQLVAAGQLDGLRDTPAALMDEAPFVRRGQVYDLLAQLHRLTGNAVPSSNLVSLGDVLWSIGGRDKPWVPLINALLKEKIPVYPGIAIARHIEAMRVPRSTMARIRLWSFDFAHYPNFKRASHLRGPEWGEYLNIGKAAKEFLVEAQLLPIDTSSYRHLCPLGALETFAERYISIWEARAALGMFETPLPAMREFLAEFGIGFALGSWFLKRDQFSGHFANRYFPSKRERLEANVPRRQQSMAMGLPAINVQNPKIANEALGAHRTVNGAPSYANT
jgi:hypothetical protein